MEENQGLAPAPEIPKEQFDTTDAADTAGAAGVAGGDTAAFAQAENVETTQVYTENGPVNPYSGKTQQELIETLGGLIERERSVPSLRSDMESIKVAFYKEGRAKIEAQREAFILNGGDPQQFKPEENPNEAKFKELLSLYRQRRDAYLNQTEADREEAYKKKVQIIEELKELVDGNETLGNTFQMFRDLQERWKDAGIVAQDKMKDLWETYHHHVENFYNYIRINKELRDLDLRKNYEAKTALAEEAERLMLEPSATEAFHKLQKLHDRWRETGPVTAEYKDTLWERFRAASTQINKRHQDYFEGIKEEQKQNLALKTELCGKVEEMVAAMALAEGGYTSRKEWDDASDRMIEIQKVWRTIGFAPKKDNTKIYERFRAACDRFFEAKRNFYKGAKSELEDNLQAKTDLCVQAEALQGSEDWKAVTDTLIELQKRWKEIGPVSRKYSDKLWNRFRGACDAFFERKNKHFGDKDSQFGENLTKKREMIGEMWGLVNEYKATETAMGGELSFDKIKTYQRAWLEIGFVPIRQKDAIQKEYREAVDALFALLRGEEKDRQMKNFKEKVKNTGGGKKMGYERDRLYNKVRQIEGEIQVLENNIGFFSRSKNADALVREIERKIVKAKEQLEMWVEKINLIDHPVEMKEKDLDKGKNPEQKAEDKKEE